MEKYYELKLNCARVTKNYPFSNDYGFIEILPQRSSIVKKGLFGNKVIPTIEYNGWFNVIAELVDDHFEDVILRKKIKYDPTGIQDITEASFDELLSNLQRGLTCYKATEINPEIAVYNIERIKSDSNILNKYKSELQEIEKKENVIQEIIYRMDNESNNTANKNKKRILSIKSA